MKLRFMSPDVKFKTYNLSLAPNDETLNTHARIKLCLLCLIHFDLLRQDLVAEPRLASGSLHSSACSLDFYQLDTG